MSVATHEAAHAIVGLLLGEDLVEVTIEPDDDVLGPALFADLPVREFPLDFVKIDKSFVQGLSRGSGEDAIINAIIGLSHAFGLEVVAEGVETLGQLESLSELGCDQAQGFLFATPGEPSAVDELIMAGGYLQT